MDEDATKTKVNVVGVLVPAGQLLFAVIAGVVAGKLASDEYGKTIAKMAKKPKVEIPAQKG